MTTALTFAVLSLLAAGCLEVAYKRYAAEERSRGMYLFGCGTVWLVLHWALLHGLGVEAVFDDVTLVHGAAAGTFLALSNILLIESLKHLDVSMGSTVYRLNTIVVVVLSVIVLGESLGLLKLAGIGLGVTAVLFMHGASGDADARALANRFLFVAITASVCRAVYGVISKAGLIAGADGNAMLLIAAACWMVGGLAYAGLREKRIRVTRAKVLYALVSGTLVFAVVGALIEALKAGEASFVVPIANLSFIVALSISVGLSMERFTLRKGTAIGLAVLSIVILAQAGG